MVKCWTFLAICALLSVLSEASAKPRDEFHLRGKSSVYNWRTKEYELFRGGSQLLRGSLGNSLEEYELKSRQSRGNNVEATFSSRNKPDVRLEIEETSQDSSVICERINWSHNKARENNVGLFEDCFSLEGAYWYGGAEDHSQQFWPINNQVVHEYQPYLTGKYSKASAVIERYWLASTGLAIIVDEQIPLFVKKNQTTICFLAQARDPYSDKSIVKLAYDICRTDSIRDNYMNDLHLYVVNKYLAKPTGLPDALMIQKPIWSTWAVYKKAISDAVVKNFANQILANNYSHSQLEIDDKWQTYYGDFTFDPAKFPNITQTIHDLNALGFRTTLWMHPFANMDCSVFYEETSHKYSVRNRGDTRPMLTTWWDGIGTSVDPTNPQAADWFVGKLNDLRKRTGIDSFKFDAGEIQFLTSAFSLYNESLTPNQYSNAYARMAARTGNMIEVRVGARTQDLPIFVRMLDKDSKWGLDNGLRSVLTTALTMSITGYNFILPDMIGGNAYRSFPILSKFPDPELFVRWAQLTAFLPAMQFSIPPWTYTNTSIKVNEICQEMVNVHETLVYEVFVRHANETIKTGMPVIRPMWFADNLDPQLFTIDDQFLVGSDILVAPILDPKTYQRTIYLPAGAWQAAGDSKVYVGPITLRNYPAPIDEIPYFINQTESWFQRKF